MVDLHVQIAELIETLRSEDPEVQERATNDLALVGQPAVLPLLKSIDTTYRFGTTIKAFPKPAELELALQNASQEVATRLNVEYFSAVAATARINNQYMSRLQQVLVRMGKPGWDEMLQLAINPPGNRFLYTIGGILSAFTTISVENLLSALEHPQVNIRIQAAFLLAKHDDPRVIPTLITMMHQPNGREFKEVDYDQLRATGARALATVGAAGIQLLIAGVDDENPQVRRVTTVGLLSIKDGRAFDGLAKLIQSQDGRQASQAIVGFEQIESLLTAEQRQKLVGWLVNWLKNSSSNVAHISDEHHYLLAKIGEPSVDPIFDILNNPDTPSEHRYEALHVLLMIFNQNPQIPHLNERLMTSILKLSPPLDQLNQVWTLVGAFSKIADQRALPYLTDLLQRARDLPDDEEGANAELCEDIERAIETIQQRL